MQSETYGVYDCIVVDDGISNTVWSLNSNAQLTDNNSIRTLTGNQWSYIRLLINGSSNIPSGSYCVEFDTVNVTGQCGLNIYQSSSHNTILSSNAHYKIIISDKIYVNVDGVAQNPQIYDTESVFQFQFVLRLADSSLEFKNLMVYPI